MHCLYHFIFIYIAFVLIVRLQMPMSQGFQGPDQTGYCSVFNQGPEHQWLIQPSIAAFVIVLL